LQFSHIFIATSPKRQKNKIAGNKMATMTGWLLVGSGYSVVLVDSKWVMPITKYQLPKKRLAAPAFYFFIIYILASFVRKLRRRMSGGITIGKPGCIMAVLLLLYFFDGGIKGQR